MGKLITYRATLIEIEIDEKERIVGHISLGSKIILEKISKTKNFPAELEDKFLHLVYSHYGEVKLGSGSVVDPQTPEAQALAHIDLLDSRVKESLARK